MQLLQKRIVGLFWKLLIFIYIEKKIKKSYITFVIIFIINYEFERK